MFTALRPAPPIFAVAIGLSACGGITLEDIQTPRPLPPGTCLAVGFLGGRDAWDDENKGVRKLALELRADGIFAETFENRRREVAERFVLSALDDSRSQRLVVYGQSFGGAAVVKFARQLEDAGVAIRLTVQVDSVGRNDALIPPNVLYALNLYQSNGWFIRGEQPIRAEEPERTTILGNLRFDYDEPPGSEISLEGVSFWKKLLRVAHAKMDRDPRVWKTVREAIRAACRKKGTGPVF